MKKNILNTVFFLLTGLSLAQVQLKWAKEISGSWGNEYGRGIVTDPSGNIYITGDITGVVDMDPGPAVYNFTVSVGADDAYLSKLDANGNLIWARQFGSPAGIENSNAVALDNAGNSIITGFFQQSVDFDPGPGTYSLTSASSVHDIFVCKLDASGNFAWAVRFGSTGFDEARAVAADALGNIYVTGYYAGTVDFDPGPGVFNLVSAGSTDAFVVKLNSSGNLIWAKSLGGPGTNGTYGNSIAVDASGNVLSCGEFYDPVDLDPGPSTYTFASKGSVDGYVSKLNVSGNFIWGIAIQGAVLDEQPMGITTDAANNIYVAGAFNDTVDFDPGPGIFNLISPARDGFVLRLNPNGSLHWAKQTGGQPLAIDLDNNGNVYHAGNFDGIVDFDPGPGTYTVSVAGTWGDMYVSKLDTGGNFVWVAPIHGSSPKYTYAVNVDPSKDVYSTGFFQQSADFDPGPSTYSMTALGNNDCFIQKLCQTSCPLSVDEIRSDDLPTIFPNPFSHQFQIHFNKAYENVSVVIYSVDGKKIKEVKQENATQLNVELNSPPGIYFADVLYREKRCVIKLVKTDK